MSPELTPPDSSQVSAGARVDEAELGRGSDRPAADLEALGATDGDLNTAPSRCPCGVLTLSDHWGRQTATRGNVEGPVFRRARAFLWEVSDRG